MMLVEDNGIVRNEEIIANIMNNYFTNITTHLKLKPTKIDPKANLESIIDTFQNHESVQRIQLANFHSKSSLKFNSISELDVKKEILNLSSKKATRKGDIPAKILKNSINTYLSELTILINNCLKEGVFPDDLKFADINPIFKKEDTLNKENYRPISILSHLSKVFERILYKQIDNFMKNKFSPYLCGFRKNHNAQYSLLKMIENWKKQLDNGEKVGVMFMYLSKAFDTINHSLLLAKLKAHGFSNQALRLLQSYLCSRFQRSIINGSFSTWNEVITGVPQGSILGPLLFNIFLNDIFLFISKCQLCNYADDNTLYKSGKNMQKIKNDPDKCHYIVISDDDPNQEIILNNDEIASSNEEKLLGILLDSKLNFDSHITSLCKKAGEKLSALARINHYLTQDQKLLLLNSEVKSQFSYCPLIWMFTSRYLNNALNSIHERALRLIYNDYELPFDRILEDNKQKSIHQKILSH